jgi:hypothetical protein
MHRWACQESQRERTAALEAEWRKREAEQAAAAEVARSVAAAAEADARKVWSGMGLAFAVFFVVSLTFVGGEPAACCSPLALLAGRIQCRTGRAHHNP